MDIQKSRETASIIIRIALSLVFLWFGINQLFNPSSFLGYLPSFMQQMHSTMMGQMGMTFLPSYSPFSVLAVRMNGIIEIIFGTLLILGIFTRAAAFILSLHLFGIALTLGYNDIMIRDIGLSIATFSICIAGPDRLCRDLKMIPKASGWMRKTLYRFDGAV